MVFKRSGDIVRLMLFWSLSHRRSLNTWSTWKVLKPKVCGWPRAKMKSCLHVYSKVLLVIVPNGISLQLVWWCIIMSQNILREDCFVIISSRVKNVSECSFNEIWSSSFFLYFIIFRAVDRFRSKRSLMVHHQKPEFLVKGLDCCLQGQGHSDGSKPH